MNRVLIILYSLWLLSACSGTQGDNNTSRPPTLYPQPERVLANPEGGYHKNTLTGEPIKPLISSSGDTILTGVPIPVKMPKSFVPKTKKVSVDRSKLSVKKAYPNKQTIPTNQKVVPLNKSKQVVFPFKQKLANDSTDAFSGRYGDTIPAKGNAVQASFSAVTPALPLRFRAGAVTDLQYLDVDQGLNLSIVNSLFADIAGNIWIGMPNGGLSIYDGLSFTHFSEKEGLKGNAIWNMLEDRNGHLWLATNVGAVRFDGTSFIHYPQTQVVVNDYISSIVEDNNGHLWFGAAAAGLIRYDGEHFTYFNENEIFRKNRINSMMIDQSGNLWIGSDRGALHFDGTNFTLYTSNEGLSTTIVTSILEDKSGNIWFGTWEGGLNRFDGNHFTHFTEFGLNISILHEDRNGHLWISSESGFFQFDGKTSTKFTQKEGLSSNLITSIIDDAEGNLWIGTYGGGVNRLVSKSFKHFTEIAGLSGSITYTLSQDLKGNLWFGSENGLTLLDGKTLTHITEKDGLNGNIIESIIRDRNGTMWIATEKGLNNYDGKSFTHFFEDEMEREVAHKTIMEDSKGNLWVGYEKGVFRFDGTNVTPFSTKEGFAHNYIASIVEDRSGNIWFASPWGGVSRFDGKTITHFSEKEGLNENKILDMHVDRLGNLWIGSYGGGVSRYDGKYFTHFSKKHGLSNDYIMSIIEDPIGRIWISSQGGLNLIYAEESSMDSKRQLEDKPIEYSIVQFKRNDGLIGLDFMSFAKSIDNENNIWWSHVKGISTLDLNTFELSSSLPSVKLSQLEINDRHIDYRNIADSLRSDITFKSVKDFENYPIGLSLSHDLNHLTFYVSAIEWSAPHKIQFSYKLEGIDEAWSKPTSEFKIDYRNIPDGTFTLKVSAIGESNVWSKPFEYTFTVRPPWWSTWWAYTLYVVFLFILVYGYIQRRTKALEQENTLLEEKVMHRTVELEQSLNNLKSTQNQLIHAEKMASLGELTAGIAHEIQNPLNFVNNFSELNKELIEEQLEEIQKGDLEEVKELALIMKENTGKIHHHGKRADEIVKGMLAHSRTGSGEKVPTDINKLADEYLRLSYHGLRAKDKSFNADFKSDFDSTLPLINVIPQDIGRVLLNLINNAFQAAAEVEKPLVQVATRKTENEIEIAVSDNGPGVPENIKDKIFQPFFTTKPTGQGTGLGLSLSYDIVKAHGGKISVHSQLENGTTFTLFLPKT